MRSFVRFFLETGAVWVLLLGVATASDLYTYTDAERTGPAQPVQFSHQVHATKLAVPCLYCHGPAERSQNATVPAMSVCMGCHAWVKKGSSPGSTEEIAKIADYYGRGASIAWVRVHRLPEHVQFKHMRHVRAGVECQTCHGQVQTMNRVYKVKDTKLRPHSLWLPAAKLEMGWCVDCHEKKGATKDCAACHY